MENNCIVTLISVFLHFLWIFWKTLSEYLSWIFLGFSFRPGSPALNTVGLLRQDYVIVSAENSDYIAVCAGTITEISEEEVVLLTERFVYEMVCVTFNLCFLIAAAMSRITCLHFLLFFLATEIVVKQQVL